MSPFRLFGIAAHATLPTTSAVTVLAAHATNRCDRKNLIRDLRPRPTPSTDHLSLQKVCSELNRPNRNFGPGGSGRLAPGPLEGEPPGVGRDQLVDGVRPPGPGGIRPGR